MVDYYYPPMVALSESGTLLRNGSGQIYSATTPDLLPITDFVGTTITSVQVTETGLTQGFIAQEPVCLWKSGEYIIPLASPAGMLEQAEAASSAAQMSALAAADAADDALAGAQAAISDATQDYLYEHGYAPLMVVSSIEAIPPGTPAGTLLVIPGDYAPIPITELHVASATATIGNGLPAGSNTLLFVRPAGLRVGDVLVAFVQSQSSDAGHVWTPPVGWETHAATEGLATRTTGLFTYTVTSLASVGSTIGFSTVGGASFRFAGVMAVIRGADTSAPVNVTSDAAGFNGLGSTNTTLGPITTTVPGCLGVAFGWTTMASTGVDTPAVLPAGWTLLADSVNPTPGGAVSRSAVAAWAAPLGDAGAKDALVLDWPEVSQRAGVMIAFAPAPAEG